MESVFKNKRIASYIRVGLASVNESHNDWLARKMDNFAACALGLAVVGKYGAIAGYQQYTAGLLRNGGDEIAAISELLQIERPFAEEINELHMKGGSAKEIAECLEYEERVDQLDLHPLTV